MHYDPDLGYDNASYGVTDVLVETIHHPAGTHEEPIYENRWIVDAEAWSETIHTGRIGYVVNGKAVTNSLVAIDGDTYYLDSKGSAATGWMSVNGAWRFFDEDGKMQTGWQDKNGILCYIDENTGKLVLNEVKTVDETAYYFDNTGRPHKKGAFISNGKEYYFDGTELVKNRWYTDEGRSFYYDAEGAKKTGLFSLNGKIYPVGDDGSAKPNTWVTVSGKKYYTDGSGAAVKGWQMVSGKKYFIDSMARLQKQEILHGRQREDAHRLAPDRRKMVFP